MAAIREYLIYGVDDEHKHLWPIHYHLIKNDFLAAIDSIRRGANPLLEDCKGTSAIALCYKVGSYRFLRHITYTSAILQHNKQVTQLYNSTVQPSPSQWYALMVYI